MSRIAALLLLLFAAQGFAQQDEESLFNQAREAYERGDFDAAAGGLNEFIAAYQKSPLLEGALYLFGEVRYRQGDAKGAAEFFRRVLNEFPESTRRTQARFLLSDSFILLGQVDAAVGLWDEVPGEEPLKATIYARAAEAYLKERNHFAALGVMLLHETILSAPNERIALREAVAVVVSERFGEKELRQILSVYPRKFPSDVALARLIRIEEEREDFFRTERDARLFLSWFPEHEFAEKARALFPAIRERIRANRIRIAVFLPLSGQLGPFGSSALAGVQLALEQYRKSMAQTGGPSVGIVIRDTEEEKGKIAAIAEEVIREFRPAAFIGPFLTREVGAVAPLAERLEVPVITPAATGALPRSRFVFRNALTNGAQARALADYAVSILGLKRFVVFYPKDSYGNELNRLFNRDVSGLGGEIVWSEGYPPEEVDFGPLIKRLKEHDLRHRGEAEYVGSGRTKKEVRYFPGFDAVFLPGDARKSAMVASQLAFYNIEDVILFGSNGWNSEDLLNIGGRFLEGALFVDGFFAESQEPGPKGFASEYRAHYGETPDLFAAQGYDVMRMLTEAIGGGAEDGRTVRSTLAAIREFPGASGVTTFLETGDAQKRLFMLQVQNGKFVQVN